MNDYSNGCNGGDCMRFDLGAEPCTNCCYADDDGNICPAKKIAVVYSEHGVNTTVGYGHLQDSYIHMDADKFEKMAKHVHGMTTEELFKEWNSDDKMTIAEGYVKGMERNAEEYIFGFIVDGTQYIFEFPF